ncbi:MAG: lipoate--protein ligase family protein [Planctomycetes bacterium]|nr:lipoate--protein ligase family protein [Planctomycetota bacterium]
MPNRVSRSGACRLMVDPPARGAWNMAVDGVLLERVAEDNVPTLRIYRWERPTLSLGYFQSYAQRRLHRASLDADVVRRLSGGGAILHDQEITYSLVLPSTHPLAANTQLLYDTVHHAIVDWLIEFSATKEISWRLALCERQQKSVRREQPFMCFERRSPGDVLLVDLLEPGSGDHKIVGSAQRRRRGSVLQHGSILWATSQAAPENYGFTNLTSVSVSLAEAAESLSWKILASLQLTGENVQLTGEILAAAEKSCANRYNLPAWTERR